MDTPFLLSSTPLSELQIPSFCVVVLTVVTFLLWPPRLICSGRYPSPADLSHFNRFLLPISHFADVSFCDPMAAVFLLGSGVIRFYSIFEVLIRRIIWHAMWRRVVKNEENIYSTPHRIPMLRFCTAKYK
jgi:hypothetical protein